MKRPVFSLLHASDRPDKWAAAYYAWMSKADNPESVEYILSVDANGPFPRVSAAEVTEVEDVASGAVYYQVAYQGRRCSVDGYNAAAKASRGLVLVQVADDFFPPEHWDSLILGALPDLQGVYCLHVNAQDPWPQIMTHAIMTRAYYERPGRGGCPNGEFFYPEYLSMGADDDLTLYAKRDGVLIEAQHLKFEHRHPANQGTPLEAMDTVYRHEDSAEAHAVKARVLEKRIRENFGHRLKTLAVITPGSSFPQDWLSEWEKLFCSLWGRFAWYRVYGTGNNIYRVRQHCTLTALVPGVPDYVLWIDSDNPPSVAAFNSLIAQMQASERNTDPLLRPIDMIGAWYRYRGLDDKRSYIAAGRSLGLRKGQLTEAEVLEALERGQLIEDLHFIGFGMLLMRGFVLAELGAAAFTPLPVPDERHFLDDDISWCARALAAGYRIYLHPAAFVEHLKFGPVPPLKGEASEPVLISDSEEKQLEEVAS